MDMYVLTGEPLYLEAVTGAWEMFRESFLHLGGAMAINEGSVGTYDPADPKGTWYPPKSYYLEGTASGEHPTGETCGSVFWVKLNQRLHRLNPEDERFVAEIERSIINIGLMNQAAEVGAPIAGVRYFALLHRHKAPMQNISSCCEGQGSRLHGSLPEYIYSYAPKLVSVDLYVQSTLELAKIGGSGSLQITSGFPLAGPAMVSYTGEPVEMSIRLRIPSW